MTPVSERPPGLLKKVWANVTRRQIPSSANLAIGTALSKAVMAMQGLQGTKKGISSALRKDWTHPYLVTIQPACSAKPPTTGTQHLPCRQVSVLNWPYTGNLIYHESSDYSLSSPQWTQQATVYFPFHNSLQEVKIRLLCHCSLLFFPQPNKTNCLNCSFQVLLSEPSPFLCFSFSPSL